MRATAQKHQCALASTRPGNLVSHGVSSTPHSNHPVHVRVKIKVRGEYAAIPMSQTASDGDCTYVIGRSSDLKI